MRVCTVPTLTTIGILFSLGAATGCGGSSDASKSATRPPAPVSTGATSTTTATAVPTAADEDRWGTRWCDIKIGSTRALVLRRMGKPTTSEPATSDGTAYDMWRSSGGGLNFYAKYDDKGDAAELQYDGPSTLLCIPSRDEDSPDKNYERRSY